MFLQLKTDEKIILVLRRHWLVIIFNLAKIVPLFALPPILWFLANNLFPATTSFSEIFWLASVLWWLFLWGWLALIWVNLYLDVWIITDQRIIDVRQKKLFKREVAELTLLKIQDITTKINGALRTSLDFGNLEIRSAGTFESDQENNIFIFEDISKPSDVQSLLSRLHQDYIRRNERRI